LLETENTFLRYERSQLDRERGDMTSKLKMYKESHPQYVTRAFERFDDVSMKNYLEDVEHNIFTFDEVGRITVYMMFFYVLVEIVGVKWLGVELFSGFAEYNSKRLIGMKYHILSVAKGFRKKGQGEETPLMDILYSSVLNILVFFSVGFITKFYGKDFSGIMEAVIDEVSGNKPTVVNNQSQEGSSAFSGGGLAGGMKTFMNLMSTLSGGFRGR